jgi:hypothetical protein
LICPCPVDNPPTGPNGECRGAAVFHIASGRLDDTDLFRRRLRLLQPVPVEPDLR